MYLHQVLFYFNDKGITNLRVRIKNTVDRFRSRIDPVEKRINQLEKCMQSKCLNWGKYLNWSRKAEYLGHSEQCQYKHVYFECQGGVQDILKKK